MAAPVRVLELRSVRGTGGGPEKTILLGTAATDPARFGITVCYIRDTRDPVFDVDDWAGRLGVDYVELRERHSFDPSVWVGLRRLARQRRIDIVHAHDYKTNLLARCLGAVDGVIPLSTVHGWTGHTRRERLVYYPADKRLLATFPRLIAVSSEIRRELVRCGASADRVDVVLNGIDHLKFRRDPSRQPLMRRSLGIGDHEFVIGAVGRLEPQKRFDLLLDAVARLRTIRPNIRLLIAGEGSARPALEAAIRRLELEDACRLLGHCPDVPAVHLAFDLFVQSSDYEGTPNAVLEAMALETPLVATSAGGTSELVEHDIHGLIVQSGSLDALVDGLSRAMADSSAAKARSRAARDRVERELSFDGRMTRVEAVYDALIRIHGRRGSKTLGHSHEYA
jgi:glycosyltransferase involved in cell wall biosynthesis